MTLKRLAKALLLAVLGPGDARGGGGLALVDLTSIEEIAELFAHTWWPYILLSLVDGPQKVPTIAQTINQQVGGTLRDYSLYRSLRELEGEGYVENLSQDEGGAAGPWMLTDDAERVVRRLQVVKKAFEEAESEAPSSSATAQRANVEVTGGTAVDPSRGTADEDPAVKSDWVPLGVDPEVPNVARTYDYMLGGGHNFAADRKMAEQVLAVMPDAQWGVLANRTFLGRAVRAMLRAGVRQFLDIGSGIPTVGNVHEIVQRANVEARVVYVDIDPVAVAHTRQILGSDDRVMVIEEDVRRPEAILTKAAGLLDFAQPVGLLLVAVLHAIPDKDDPLGVVQRLRERLAPGSYLAIGHATADNQPEMMRSLADVTRQTPTPITMRSLNDILGFFEGFRLLPPGVVWAPLWRPEPGEDPVPDPQRSGNYVGVGRLAGRGASVRPRAA
jgi:DNA-binding HxlR family transcriptional regulator